MCPDVSLQKWWFHLGHSDIQVKMSFLGWLVHGHWSLRLATWSHLELVAAMKTGGTPGEPHGVSHKTNLYLALSQHEHCTINPSKSCTIDGKQILNQNVPICSWKANQQMPFFVSVPWLRKVQPRRSYGLRLGTWRVGVDLTVLEHIMPHVISLKHIQYTHDNLSIAFLSTFVSFFSSSIQLESCIYYDRQ